MGNRTTKWLIAAVVCLAGHVPASRSLAWDYAARTLPEMIKQHEVILVARVTKRAGGRVTLVAERVIKGKLPTQPFQLPDTWQKKSRYWQPVYLLERKRYLLMLQRDKSGKLIFSKDLLAESLREIEFVDAGAVRTAIIVHHLIVAKDAAGREKVLLDAWSNESDKVKVSVLRALMQMKKDKATIPFLVRCIQSGAERGNLMEMSSILIGRHQYRESAPELLKALKKDDWACIYPAQALAKLKEKRAYEPLLALIRSPVAQNRVYFTEALAALDDPRSIPFLIKTAGKNIRGLDEKAGTYRSYDVRENQFAVAGLGRMRARQAVETLEKVASLSINAKLRKLARESLLQIRSKGKPVE